MSGLKAMGRELADELASQEPQMTRLQVGNDREGACWQLLKRCSHWRRQCAPSCARDCCRSAWWLHMTTSAAWRERRGAYEGAAGPVPVALVAAAGMPRGKLSGQQPGGNAAISAQL